MMTKAFVDYNGVVVEKYDVTRPMDPHRVDAEYGNQGLDFKGVAKEGYVFPIFRASNEEWVLCRRHYIHSAHGEP